MKKLFFALLISTSALAAEVVVMDIPARDLRGADRVDSKFVVNEELGTVSARLDATRTEVRCMGGYYGGGYRPGPYGRPYRHCMTYVRNIMTQTEEVPGMVVENKIVSLDGVVCGKMGVSRIFKVPTLYLNGSCKLKERMERVNGEKRLIVKVITK
jgi:hypothetical protein